MVEFAGFEMPLHYGSQLEEHHHVRNQVGMFDVSHMMITDISGPHAQAFLRHLIANDVAKLKPFQALYGIMLNHNGGILDDLIVYDLGPQHYRLITNAGTREKISTWLRACAKTFKVTLTPRDDLAMIAIQGPSALTSLKTVLGDSLIEALQQLKPFFCLAHQDKVIARTGYTGEDGVEIMLPATHAPALWDHLIQQGVHACGLGARDTLRLEAGLNLYSVDMNESNTPFDSNLAWTVAWEPQDRAFIGREALETQRNQPYQLVGLKLKERGVPRAHQSVVVDDQILGEITSGTFSPSLQCGIAFARLKKPIPDVVFVKIRDKLVPAEIVKGKFKI